MNEINFTKLTAAGNDFVLIDKELNNNISLSSELIKAICDRRYGIGADGILTIDNCDLSDFRMEYFNADGSAGMLCGNGARSIIKYAHNSGRLNSSSTEFTFQNQLFSGEVLEEEQIKFNLNEPSKLKLNLKVEVNNTPLNGSFIDTGAHHFVVDINEQKKFYESLDSFPVLEFGRKLRNSKQFAPLGTNVNFISINNGIINIRTYERGVEDETLACGTGSVASAILSFLNKKVSTPVKLKTRSGENLIVDFEYIDEKFINVSLVGPAKIVFEGKYKIRGN